MMSTNNNFAQGTIEYLVIIATIIVIALIAVGLFISVSSSPSQQISSSSDKLGNVAAGGISIVESVIDPSGDSIIRLSNNSNEGVTLKKISVGGVDNNYNDLIAGLGSSSISLDGLSDSCPCVSGQLKVKCVFVFEYVTVSGLTKIDSKTLNVDCVSDAKASDDVIEPIESSPVNLCGSLSTPQGYTQVTTCDEINGAGNYIFASDMTCDITINANDININGNYCTLSGNISGNNSVADQNGFSFTLINLTANNVTSNNTIYPWDPTIARSGGNITLVDSNVDAISSNGSASNEADVDSGNSGHGGRVILTRSSASSISSNAGEILGGSGDLFAGSGGSITLSDSIVSGSIYSNGGNSTGNGWNPAGGIGGSITLTNSLAGNIYSIGGSVVSGDSSGGSGGVISLTDSTVNLIDVNGGSSSYLTLGGSGGNVTAIDSSITQINSNGGRAYGTGGNGGTIDLTNALGIEYIYANGADSDSTGGNGGSVNFNSVSCPETIVLVSVLGGTPSGSNGTVSPEGCGQ